MGLTASARRPDRRCWIDDRTGSYQVQFEDLAAEREDVRTLTDHPGGVSSAQISDEGDEIWWFRDHAGDEIGLWVRQRPDEASPQPVAPSFPVGRARGLAFDRSIAAFAIGRQESTDVFVVDDRGARHVGSLTSDACVVSLDGSATSGTRMLLARRVAAGTGWSTVVWSGEGRELVAFDDDGQGAEPLGFGPDGRILLAVTRSGRRVPAWWDPGASPGLPALMPIDIGVDDGDLDVRPVADGTLVVKRSTRGRDGMFLLDTGGGTRIELDLPPGTVDSWATRRDGRIDVVWSSATHPPCIVTTGEAPPLSAATAPSVRDLNVEGPGGRIHVLVTGGDETGGAPAPVVFLVHGGPAFADRDEWNPVRATWAAHGFVVVQANYRGSTGYGTDWTRANHGRPGETELADLVAVREHLVADGTIDPRRVVLAGRSWGGYLALLAAGMTPELWTVAVAEVPVGDTTLVYDGMLEELRVAYRERFGGPPDEVPAAYRRASPLTYVGQVRAPVYISAARDDPRCPIGQIDVWVAAARAAGVDVTYEVHDGGHANLVTADRIGAMQAQLDFVLQRVDV